MNWTASKDRGYGQFGLARGRIVRAYRWIYTQLVGPVPPGMVLDHLCRNPSCVNIMHLEVVTSGTNTLRGNSPSAINARKTECLRGHPYTPENTIRDKSAGKRRCKICRKKQRRRRYLDWKAARGGARLYEPDAATLQRLGACSGVVVEAG